jgi:oligopeptide transport system substrate-binding protein
VFSHFGSGLLAGADTYLSRHFAVNPALFFKERNLLATALGKHTLYVDHRAPVTTFFDMLLNQAVEAHRGQARHGSCGMGFGETIGRHESAYALSVGDLLDKDGLYEKLVRIRDEYVPARRKALGLLDDYTLQITLKNPVPFFLKTLSHYTTFPAPKATIEKFGHEWVKPANIVSNGAFALKEWTPNERLIAERNPHYWDNEHTVLNKVIYLEIVSDTAAYNRYRASELHYTTYPLEQYQQIKRQSPEELVSAPMLTTYYYVFNTQRKPFDDVRVRKALSLAIDRDTITEKILGQGQLSAFSLTPPSVDGFELKRPASELMSKEERIKQAKALLGEAGYGPDKPLTVDILYNTNEGHKKIALAISSMWKHNLGVKAELNNMEWKTMVSALNEGDFGVSRYSWNGDYNDASTFLDIMTSSSSANSGKWFNKEYDALLAKAHDAKDPAERNRLYQQAEVLIDEEAPIAPVYFYVKSRLLKPNVKGYPYQNPQDLVYAKDLYLTAQ